MARLFNGTSDKAVGASAPVTGNGNISVSVWFLTSDTSAGTHPIVFWGDGATAGAQMLLAVENGVIWTRWGVGNTANGGSGYNDGKWHNICLVKPSGVTTSGVIIYVDGASLSLTTAGASVLSPSSLNPINIGNNTSTSWFGGRVSDPAVWNIALTAAEASGLSRGERSRGFRPLSLVFWSPLDGVASPEPDLSGSKNNLTLTGTSAANGPPTSLLFPSKTGLFPAAAATVLTLASKTWNWATQPPTVLAATTLSLSSKSWVWANQSPTLQFANVLTTKAWNWTKQNIVTNTVNVLTSKIWAWANQPITLIGGATVLTLATATWNWANQAIIATGGGIAAGGIAAKEWIIRRRRRS